MGRTDDWREHGTLEIFAEADEASSMPVDTAHAVSIIGLLLRGCGLAQAHPRDACRPNENPDLLDRKVHRL